MLKVVEPLEEKAPEVVRDTGRALFWRMVVLYHLGSLAAVVITLILVLLGLEFTGWQWISWLIGMPVGVGIYTSLDVVAIRRQVKPIRTALNALDRGEHPGGTVLADALVQSLNLPFLSFLRVTCLHGPMATLMLTLIMLVGNVWLDAQFATWQILTFAATVMFFASPTHAIFEYFAVSRELEPTIKRLNRALGGALPTELQSRLIAIRLKTKLLYLAIFVAALPLIFFAFSVIFKIERLLATRGLNVELNEMMPLYIWIAGVLAVCTLGSLIMALLTANEVSRSAARMLEAMSRVESGRLDDAQLDVISTDEYADLFHGFGLMVESLREEQRILAISDDLAGELQLDVLIARIMTATTELLNAERSTLFMYDPKTDELYSIYAEGLKIARDPHPRRQGHRRRGVQQRAAGKHRRPLCRSALQPRADHRTGFHTNSILCTPIANKAGDADRRHPGAQQARAARSRSRTRRGCAHSPRRSRSPGKCQAVRRRPQR